MGAVSIPHCTRVGEGKVELRYEIGQVTFTFTLRGGGVDSSPRFVVLSC